MRIRSKLSQPCTAIALGGSIIVLAACGGGASGTTAVSTGGSTAAASDTEHGGATDADSTVTATRGGSTTTVAKSSNKNSTGGNSAFGGSGNLGGTAQRTNAAGGSNAAAGGSSANAGGNGSLSQFVYPAPVQPWQPTPACVAEAKKRVLAMSIQQKAGQMVQGDSASTKPADVVTYNLGSILSGGGSDPAGGDSADLWVSMVDGFLAQGQKLGIPIVYGTDSVHGNNNVSGAVIFPHNIGLGCTRNPRLVEEIGKITALETRAVGIQWAFAPVAGPALDERWGRTYETFAETPELAAELALATVRGLQGETLSSATSVLACAKHFSGDGTTDRGINEGDSKLSDADFRRLAIEPYQPAINAGVGSIMVSYSSHNGTKMSGHKNWLSDVLKGTMGFAGFLVSDWRAVQQLGSEEATRTDTSPAPTRAALASAINAGMDMIMESVKFGKVAQYIQEAADASRPAEEQIPIERIDDAVTRILTIKCEMGMLDPSYSAAIDSELTSRVGSPEHREVARRAVRESMVLLKNDDNVLPLPKQGIKLLVSGSAADSKAKQCGGWTIDWQGLGGAAPLGGAASDTTATTILQGLREAVGESNLVYSANGSSDASGITHAVVVVGETPYAESAGDVVASAATAKPLSLNLSASDIAAIDAAKQRGVPTAVVVISGRPLLIADHLSKAGAWVAAWLPGSEGNGVADVLFGEYKPTGKLSHSWPKSLAQIPINRGDPDYETDPPLFEYGYGLSY